MAPLLNCTHTSVRGRPLCSSQGQDTPDHKSSSLPAAILDAHVKCCSLAGVLLVIYSIHLQLRFFIFWCVSGNYSDGSHHYSIFSIFWENVWKPICFHKEYGSWLNFITIRQVILYAACNNDFLAMFQLYLGWLPLLSHANGSHCTTVRWVSVVLSWIISPGLWCLTVWLKTKSFWGFLMEMLI